MKDAMPFATIPVTLPPTPLPPPARARRTGGTRTLAIGDSQIGLSFDDALFQGMGSVQVAGCQLRSAKRPLFVDIRTPDGVRLTNYRVVSTSPDGAGQSVLLSARSVREPGAPMEWMLHESRPRVDVSDWAARSSEADAAMLELRLQPAERRFGSHLATGFSYQYRLRSQSLAVYKIVDRGTWEPGGQATGQEVWMRGIVPGIARIERVEDHYSTEWFLPSSGNPNVYQFFPLQTHLQGFTFTAGSSGVLITFPSRPAHVRTLIQKPAGVNEIEHWHEHCGDLAMDFQTAPMEVLFVPGTFDRTDRINLYEAVRRHVWNSLHEQAGIRPERVTTFGFIEQWDPADLDHYRRAGLPKLLDAGVKTIGLANHFRNNMNVLGVANMCCTLDLRVAESVGESNLRAFCHAAAAAGASVEMWGNTAISSLAMLLDRNGSTPPDDPVSSAYRELKRADEPFVRTPTGAIDADHYAPSFLVLNLRDPTVRRWWRTRWLEAYDRIGIRGIFLDSSFNLSSDKFHWNANVARHGRAGATIDQEGVLGHVRPTEGVRTTVQSQYFAHLDLVREMQEMGYRYSGEDCGPFGVSRCGPGVRDRLDNLSLWVDSIAHFDPAAIAEAGADPYEVFFRGLAYRLMWMICWDPRRDRLSFRQSGWRSDADTPTDRHVQLFHIYNAVEQHMDHRQVLGDEQVIAYTGRDGTQIAWCCAASNVPLKAMADVEDLTTNQRYRGDSLHGEAGHVYRIVPTDCSPRSPVDDVAR